jgi:cytochrome oxidase assembly protein ShyY1
VLVDRGWVPNADTAETLPRYPAAPSQPVTLTGWARRGEASLGRTMPRGQLASINTDEAASQVGEPLVGGYVVMQVERLPDGTAPDRPTALEAPDTGLGPHQAYAFQWWGAMLLGFVLVFFGARREYLDGQDSGEDSGRDAGRGPARDSRTRPRRPAKVRIWDEEDG